MGERQGHKASSTGNQQGSLLYATEMEGGSADESQYPHDREISCVACGAKGAVYTRWGKKTCGSTATTLYTGFIAGAYYTNTGGGYNHLCMHPQPEYPEGYSTGNQNGNL